ncbi:MAG: DNA polymerase IV [Candidatus Cloacimonadales bacterium]
MNCKKIIHVDMDAFFAAVEERDHPEYRGKPVIVGGRPDSRGVVSTCNYLARKYGVHSAMPSAMAVKLCPHAIFVSSNFAAYNQVAEIVRDIFYEYTDLVQPVSIDEAYLDVTVNKQDIASATQIAAEIRQKIYQRTQLTASAGVSYNKFLAKTASDLDKPDGLVVIRPGQAAKILDKLPIGKFHGVGKVTEKKMKRLGINCGADLKQYSLAELLKHFGKVGSYYFNIVRGIDDREVTTSSTRKSLGKETTFAQDISEIEEMCDVLDKIAARLHPKLIQKKIKAKTITVKIKFANFEIASRSKTYTEEFDEAEQMAKYAKELLQNTIINNCAVRLLGISLSNLISTEDTKDKQLFFEFYNS